MKYHAYCLTKECGEESTFSAYDDARDWALHHGVAKKEHRARVVRVEPLEAFVRKGDDSGGARKNGA